MSISSRMGSIRRTSFFVAVLLVFSGLMFVTPAQAYVGNNYIRNEDNHLCLTAESQGGGFIYTRTCVMPLRSDKNQLWEPQYVRNAAGADVVRLRNIRTNSCLARYQGGLFLRNCSSSVFWEMEWAAIGTWKKFEIHQYNGLTDRGFTYDCVEGNQWQQVNVYDCNSSNRQLWKFGA